MSLDQMPTLTYFFYYWFIYRVKFINNYILLFHVCIRDLSTSTILNHYIHNIQA